MADGKKDFDLSALFGGDGGGTGDVAAGSAQAGLGAAKSTAGAADPVTAIANAVGSIFSSVGSMVTKGKERRIQQDAAIFESGKIKNWYDRPSSVDNSGTTTVLIFMGVMVFAMVLLLIFKKSA